MFTKPFSDANEDIRVLSDKLETAAPQSQFIFREALDSIREKVRRRRSVVQALSDSGQPVMLLYDVNVSGKAGSARIDFVALGPTYILAINVSDLKIQEMPIDLYEFGPRAPYPGVVDSEEHAKVLLEALRESGGLSGKMLRNVWPVLVLSDEEEENLQNEGGSFSSDFSRIFPDVRSAQVISCRELAGLMEALSGPEYASAEIPPKKLSAMSDYLMNYDAKVTACPVSYRTQKKPLFE
jgi:hypothetical protein